MNNQKSWRAIAFAIAFYGSMVLVICFMYVSIRGEMDRNKLFSEAVLNGLRVAIQSDNNRNLMKERFLSATASYDIDPERFLVRETSGTLGLTKLWVGFDFSKLGDSDVIGYCFETMKNLPEYLSGTKTSESAPEFVDIHFDHRKHNVVWMSARDF
mgnify:CR=1 FL=1